MAEHLPVRKMKFRIGRRGQCGVRPGHPGVRHAVRMVNESDEPVRLECRSRSGRYIADVGIDTVRIERCRDRTGRRELMCEDVILKLSAGYGLIAQAARSESPAFAGPFARRP